MNILFTFYHKSIVHGGPESEPISRSLVPLVISHGGPCGPILLVGCNNGIGGFHENLVIFWESKLPDSLLALNMPLKKCSFQVQ